MLFSINRDAKMFYWWSSFTDGPVLLVVPYAYFYMVPAFLLLLSSFFLSDFTRARVRA